MNTEQPAFQVQIVPVTPLQQNAALVWAAETKEAAVVDPGGDQDLLLRAAKELELNITAIWLTHGHIDHVGAATAMKEALGCPIIGPHQDDQFLLDGVEMQAAQFGLVGAKNVQPDRYLSEGDSVELSRIKFDVLHCPGHSPGHIVFVRPDDHFAIVGDVLFRGSIGRTDLPGGNHEQLIRSVVEKLWPLGNETQFICGHGPGSTFGQERMDNAFVSDHALGT